MDPRVGGEAKKEEEELIRPSVEVLDEGCSQPKKLKMEEDGFAPEDSFSRLPDLCLLEVFKHVKRADLATMMAVSKRFAKFYYEKSLEKAKWEKGQLLICQTRRGFGFRLSLMHDNYPWKISEEQWEKRQGAYKLRDYSYHYEAYKDENGALKERRYVNGSLSESSSTQRLCWTVPDELFTALAVILKHHEVELLTIDGIHFETPLLFTKLHSLLAGHRLWMIMCNDMPCVQMTDEIKISFALFIKGAERVQLTTSNEVPSVLNNDVLDIICGSRLRNFTDHTLNIRQAYDHNFLVGKSRLEELVKISNLEAPSMEIEADYVPLFVTLYMEARDYAGDELGQWIFAVNDWFDVTGFVRHLGRRNFTIEQQPDCLKIIRKRDGMTARIFQHEYDIDDEDFLIFFCTVQFKYAINN